MDYEWAGVWTVNGDRLYFCLLQAYRLEPLINPLYSQIKPVRIDSSSKISKEAVDHAEGTRSKPHPPIQQSGGKSWFSSLALFASSSVVSKKTSPEPTRAKSADKVGVVSIHLVDCCVLQVADSDKHLKAHGTKVTY